MTKERDVIMNIATSLYFKALCSDDGQPARAFLWACGVKVGEAFRFGWALDHWDALVKELKRNDCDLDLAVGFGLICKGNTPGSYYDKLRGRLTYAIRDDSGATTGFVGYDLDGQEPRYLNAGEIAYKESRDEMVRVLIAALEGSR